MSVNGILYPTSLKRKKPLARTAKLKRVALPRGTKRIKAKRSKPRRGHETPVEHDAVKQAVLIRSGGRCEGAVDTDGQIVHAPDCWGFADWEHGHPMHTKSRGADGDFIEENIRWGCIACHQFKHGGFKPCPNK